MLRKKAGKVHVKGGSETKEQLWDVFCDSNSSKNQFKNRQDRKVLSGQVFSFLLNQFDDFFDHFGDAVVDLVEAAIEHERRGGHQLVVLVEADLSHV